AGKDCPLAGGGKGKGCKVKYGFFPGCAYHAAAGYSESTAAVCRTLGIELAEIPEWNCCGATTYLGIDDFQALALAGRIFALAQTLELKQIVTVCNACYTTLRKANQMLAGDPEKLARINRLLSPEGIRIEGSLRIRHLLDVLVNDVPKDAWSRNQPAILTGLKVAGYYGCQLTRPPSDLDRPENPEILEKFIETLGFVAIEHSAKTRCCGAAHAVPYAGDCRVLIARIIREVRTKGADLVISICPMCQFNLDAGQQGLGLAPVPVPFFTQLAGMALGLKPGDLGLKKLLVPLKGTNLNIS
ncbi:MAG: CoB--CoM heterodisulfide reductase iron-sulfur subunit B family protein, partial [Proteobacteria bacterium]|nr:CoB--CoM heterodisulfide reductase iron-sulfur subunit B family protein [Pseudomonadota bacterium]